MKYKPEDFIVEFDGEPACILNARLFKEQGCYENLEAIKAAHQERIALSKKMENENDRTILKKYDKEYTKLEYKLQKLWKFPKNAAYHRFWDRPKCSCPVLDNEDRYPTGIDRKSVV